METSRNSRLIKRYLSAAIAILLVAAWASVLKKGSFPTRSEHGLSDSQIKSSEVQEREEIKPDFWKMPTGSRATEMRGYENPFKRLGNQELLRHVVMQDGGPGSVEVAVASIHRSRESKEFLSLLLHEIIKTSSSERKVLLMECVSFADSCDPSALVSFAREVLPDLDRPLRSKAISLMSLNEQGIRSQVRALFSTEMDLNMFDKHWPLVRPVGSH
jgi:hypothetical protein